jgi:hypothetical protein
METLEGFPNPPALWLRWAKPTSANAGKDCDGNPRRVSKPSRALASVGKAHLRQRGRYPLPGLANDRSFRRRRPTANSRATPDHRNEAE